MVFINPKQKNRNDPPPPIDGIPIEFTFWNCWASPSQTTFRCMNMLPTSYHLVNRHYMDYECWNPMEWVQQLFKLFFRPSLSRNWLMQLQLGSVSQQGMNWIGWTLSSKRALDFPSPLLTKSRFVSSLKFRKKNYFRPLFRTLTISYTNCSHLRDKLPITCDNELMTSLYLQDKQN